VLKLPPVSETSPAALGRAGENLMTEPIAFEPLQSTLRPADNLDTLMLSVVKSEKS
jgi:hypothetical protein